MKNKYSLNLDFESWLVKQPDIKNLIEIFSKRLTKSDLEIEASLKFRNGTERAIFSSFDEFDAFIHKDVIGMKKSLLNLRILSSFYKNNIYKMAWIDVDFEYSEANFYVKGEGPSTVKDWTTGFFTEVEQLSETFKQEPEVVELIKQSDPSKFLYKDNVVILDYHGELKAKFEQQLRKKRSVNAATKISWLDSPVVKGIGLVSAIVGIIAFALYLLGK